MATERRMKGCLNEKAKPTQKQQSKPATILFYFNDWTDAVKSAASVSSKTGNQPATPRFLRAGVSGANREATADRNVNFYGGYTAEEESKVLSQCPKRTKASKTNLIPIRIQTAIDGQLVPLIQTHQQESGLKKPSNISFIKKSNFIREQRSDIEVPSRW